MYLYTNQCVFPNPDLAEWAGHRGVAPTAFMFFKKNYNKRERDAIDRVKKIERWNHEAYTGHMKVENRVREVSKATSPYHV